MTTLDVLLHPVRLRILQTFLGGRHLTPAQIAAEMGDVPVARLYRHINLLVEASVIEVVAERQARGATERTYALRGTRAVPSPDESRPMSREDHMHAFTAFVAALLASYDQYLSNGNPEPARDGVGYSMNALWLTDTEYATFLSDITRTIAPLTQHRPGPGRTRRLVASAFMPMPTRSVSNLTATKPESAKPAHDS